MIAGAFCSRFEERSFRRRTPERVMPPTFPTAERIELQNPPLELVVCQVRFPIVLGLANNQPPEAFHRAIRADYPATRRGHRAEAHALIEASAEPFVRTSKSTFWVFEDKDGHWTVSLGAEFLALETRRYRQFNEFVERFLRLTGLAAETYGITLRDRLGLRYLDQVGHARQPFLPQGWTAAINPELLPLRRFCGEGEPQMNHFQTRFSFAPKQMLSLGIALFDRGFPGADEDTLILDFDCFSEHRDTLDGIRDDLFRFKEVTYNAFRWAFGDLIRFFTPANTAAEPNTMGPTV
jgi:uncharacterized protein (TIGR04255 family)